MKFDYNQIKYLIDKQIANKIKPLLEMAVSRDNFIIKADNLSKQIFQNWVLIKYCTLSNNSSFIKNKNHWSAELSGHLWTCARTKITKSKDSTKEKAMIFLWIKERDLDNPKDNDILYIVEDKRLKEKIPFDKNWIQSINDLKKSLKTLAKVIAYSKSKEEIDRYIETI